MHERRQREPPSRGQRHGGRAAQSPIKGTYPTTEYHGHGRKSRGNTKGPRKTPGALVRPLGLCGPAIHRGPWNGLAGTAYHTHSAKSHEPWRMTEHPPHPCMPRAPAPLTDAGRRSTPRARARRAHRSRPGGRLTFDRMSTAPSGLALPGAPDGGGGAGGRRGPVARGHVKRQPRGAGRGPGGKKTRERGRDPRRPNAAQAGTTGPHPEPHKGRAGPPITEPRARGGSRRPRAQRGAGPRTRQAGAAPRAPTGPEGTTDCPAPARAAARAQGPPKGPAVAQKGTGPKAGPAPPPRSEEGDAKRRRRTAEPRSDGAQAARPSTRAPKGARAGPGAAPRSFPGPPQSMT